jgi:hypothetical protein
MAHYKIIQKLLIQRGLPFFTTGKTIIWHLPNNTWSEYIRVALQEMGYEVISLKK